MNILVLNGSPRGQSSNTLKITNSFLDGLNEKSKNFIQMIAINKAQIEPCLGCYACWTKTPGKCVIKDDMTDFIQKYLEADLIIWSFPLYYFGMPSKIKGFLDRLLPMNLPGMEVDANGMSGHPSRYDLSHQRHVLISTCGFFRTEGNYDALVRQFEILFGRKLTKIICPEGELFRVPQLSSRTGEYLTDVTKAGKEFATQGCFSPDTLEKLGELLYPSDTFMEMANASWDIADTGESVATGQQIDKSYRFVRQMAATYNASSYTKDITIEMHFTDIDKTYQLLLGKEKCIVKSNDFLKYTTRIETPFDVWLQISEKKVSGSEAMMKGLYKVLGDFDTMLKFSEFFGSRKEEEFAGNPVSVIQKSSNMLLMLIPFLALWVFLPMNSQIGAMLGIAAAAVTSILHFWWKPTPYERIGAFSVTMIGVYILAVGNADWQIALPSFVFGSIWLVSSFLRIPLSAFYSSKGYGGEAAFENALFIKTNRILTTMWGVVYLLLGIATLCIAGTAIAPHWGLIGNIPTALMGLFTAWFSKWYPAKVARG